MDSNTVTPAAHYLFAVNPNAEELDQKHSEGFHKVIAKLGYIMKRARPDIESQTMAALIPLVQAEIDMYAAREI